MMNQVKTQANKIFFIKAIEWDLWQVYVSSSLGAAFNYACVALYFESAVLAAHPVSEVGLAKWPVG